MKIAKGNDKLGKNCLIVSRPVGLTCPSSCFFLGNGCYAEFTEKRFPNARKASLENLIVSAEDIRAVIQQAIDKNLSIRIHERGDFLLNDKPDKAYIKAWKDACKGYHDIGALPDIWTYSHGYYKVIADLQNYGIRTYASIHNSEDLKKAKRAGFKLFANCTTIPRKKGGSADAPKLVILDNVKFITCPEQRRGRSNGGVTCTGSGESIKCDLCVRGLANVAFLEH